MRAGFHWDSNQIKVTNDMAWTRSVHNIPGNVKVQNTLYVACSGTLLRKNGTARATARALTKRASSSQGPLQLTCARPLLSLTKPFLVRTCPEAQGPHTRRAASSLFYAKYADYTPVTFQE